MGARWPRLSERFGLTPRDAEWLTYAELGDYLRRLEAIEAADAADAKANRR